MIGHPIDWGKDLNLNLRSSSFQEGEYDAVA